jgi:hypothetical protein
MAKGREETVVVRTGEGLLLDSDSEGEGNSQAAPDGARARKLQNRCIKQAKSPPPKCRI